MTSKILTTSDNNKQYCKGCEKTLPLNLFTVNGKSFRTCNTCRVQNKEVYQRKIMQNNADVDRVMVDFHDFDDYIADLFENMNNSTNKENHEFKLSCTIKNTRLEGDLKEWANCIVKIISDVDEYIWV
jgi:predicted AlkP superfamily phosphohydrolase/phosphomutase